MTDFQFKAVIVFPAPAGVILMIMNDIKAFEFSPHLRG